jgi:hypothetical protein
MSIKIIFAIISLVCSLGIFIPYYLGISRRETKPHLLTWTTWFLLTALGFVLSLRAGGGMGSYIFALQSVLCLAVVIFAILKREKNITVFDGVVFFSAIIILFFYAATKDVLVSAILAATVDCLGYVPTVRKSFQAPYQESALAYFFAMISWVLALGALQAYTLDTLVYPVALVLVDGFFVIFLLIRRRQLAV